MLAFFDLMRLNTNISLNREDPEFQIKNPQNICLINILINHGDTMKVYNYMIKMMIFR